MKKTINIGHSPDSDDAFMFYAIAKSKIPLLDFEFNHVIEDIQSLNQRALNKELEVTAISIHAYPSLQKDYALLSSGASMGDNYGPVVVSKKPLKATSIKGARVAIPGKLTSAYLALMLFEKDFEAVFTPFDKVTDAVLDDSVDLGVIIHEGQLLYEKMGLHSVLDLGVWWKEKEDLPLPLGANAIIRSLGKEDISKISHILKSSIEYALENRKEAMDYAMQYAGPMDKSLADKFVTMYVNDYTVDFGDKGRKAVRRFLDMGYEKGILKDKIKSIDFY